MSDRRAFGAIIVVLLLVLYVLLVTSAIHVLHCGAPSNCKPFTDSMALALSAIGGLVSAVVIAELAIADPGKPPVRRLLASNASPRQVTLLRIVTGIYLFTWLAVGVWVLSATWQVPDKVPALTALGRSWIGLAVAAGYAYFGIKPEGS